MNAVLGKNLTSDSYLDKSKHIIFKCIIMFMYIFEVNCSAFGLPTFVTTNRLAVVLAFIYILLFKSASLKFKDTNANKVLRNMIIFQLILLLYIMCINFMIGKGNGDNIQDSIIRFLMFGMLAVILFEQVFDNIDELMKVILIVTLVQCVIIVIFLFAPGIQRVSDSFFGLTETYSDLRRRGYPTGIGCTTSKGSLALSLGIVSTMYLIFTNEKQPLRYVLYFIFITFVSTVLARTGLVVSCAALLFLLIAYGKNSINKILKIFGIILSVVILAVIIFKITGFMDTIIKLFSRLIALSENGMYDEYFGGYIEGNTTVIPPISLKTIIGTAMTSGISGNGVTVNVDGGFLRNYVAFGLPLAILFYILMLKFLTDVFKNISNKNIKLIGFFVTVLIFIGEFKEYFIYDYYMVSIHFLIFILYHKNKKILKITR